MALNLNFHYIQGSSFLYTFDVRCKWLAFVVFAFATFYLPFPSFLLVAFPIVTYALLKHGVALKSLFTSKAWILFLGLIFLMHAITFSEENLKKGLIVCSRLAFIIMLSQLFISTTKTDEMRKGLSYFLRFLPTWLNHRITMMVILALRFVPLFFDELEETRAACLSLVGKRKNPFLFFKLVILPFLRRIPLIAEEYSASLVLKGYREDKPVLIEPFKARDIFWLICFVGFVILIFVGYGYLGLTINLLREKVWFYGVE